MKIDGKHYRTIWLNADGWSVEIIDQTKLPLPLRDRDAADARRRGARRSRTMQVRGAPLIGATAAYGVCAWLARRRVRRGARRAPARCSPPRGRRRSICAGRSTRCRRPCATCRAMRASPPPTRAPRRSATRTSRPYRRIGEHGLGLIRAHAEKKKGERVNILTHCNAGWLACVDWGTALAPIYRAHDEGIPVHVWVDETRPRNQGASLTAFELGAHGVPHTIIADNAGGHLMQKSSSISASSAPTAPRRPATSPTRSAPISRRSPRTTTACRSLWRCPSRPSTGASRTAASSRSRSAAATK